MPSVLNKIEIVNYIVNKAKTNTLPFFQVIDIRSWCKHYNYLVIINKDCFYTNTLKELVEKLSLSTLDDIIKQIEVFDNKVMTIYNNHNPRLVDKINQCWNKKQADFQDILHLLAVRYSDELESFFNHSINLPTIGVSQAIASDILTHICDDKDLECIIAYCRI